MQVKQEGCIVKRIITPPILSALIIVLIGPLKNLNVLLNDVLFCMRIISFELSPIIDSSNFVIVSIILSCFDHSTLEIQTVFDSLFSDHPVLILKLFEFLRPEVFEYVNLIGSKINKESLSSPPVNDSIFGNITIKLIRKSALIDFDSFIEVSTVDIEACLLWQEIVSKDEN